MLHCSDINCDLIEHHNHVDELYSENVFNNDAVQQ